MARKLRPAAQATPEATAEATKPRPGTDGSTEPITPPPPATIVKTRRNPRLIALAVALVAASGGLGTWAFQQLTHTSEVLSVRNTIHAGELIEANDLGAVSVNTTSGLKTIPAAQLDSIIGKRAILDIPAGGVVPPDALADTSLPARGSSVVGIASKSGMAPASNIAVGSKVRLVYLPETAAVASNKNTNRTTGQSVTDPVTGIVVNITRTPDGTATNVDVLVPDTDAPNLQAAAAQNRVVIVLDSKDR